MTEIMPVPRNSNITVLRPPSIRRGIFIGGDGPSLSIITETGYGDSRQKRRDRAFDKNRH